ncbi:mucin-2-like [Pyrus x bretschneideri]|uniref:mucin-2-like n=1 Tax=Pyrus x bretschneideri TaxID=225117 RepID=UPI00202E8D14|nr:mucin-2-like [Pyrus x bretschneideri]
MGDHLLSSSPFFPAPVFSQPKTRTTPNPEPTCPKHLLPHPHTLLPFAAPALTTPAVAPKSTTRTRHHRHQPLTHFSKPSLLSSSNPPHQIPTPPTTISAAKTLTTPTMPTTQNTVSANNHHNTNLSPPSFPVLKPSNPPSTTTPPLARIALTLRTPALSETPPPDSGRRRRVREVLEDEAALRLNFMAGLAEMGEGGGVRDVERREVEVLEDSSSVVRWMEGRAKRASVKRRKDMAGLTRRREEIWCGHCGGVCN